MEVLLRSCAHDTQWRCSDIGEHLASISNLGNELDSYRNKKFLFCVGGDFVNVLGYSVWLSDLMESWTSPAHSWPAEFTQLN